MGEIVAFDVRGYPPAKSETKSLLGLGHRHAVGVILLLEAAQAATAMSGVAPFGAAPVGLAVEVVTPDDGNRSDATNWLGGIGDVLQDKGRPRGLDLAHLGDLIEVGLFDDDRQIEEIRFSWREGQAASTRSGSGKCPAIRQRECGDTEGFFPA